MKKILVLVVRHGEREDEAQAQERSAYRKSTSKLDKYDPKLTPPGYWQGVQAFTNLVKALEYAKIQKVAVFTSPLRRAIGTSIMLSVAASNLRQSRETGLGDSSVNVDSTNECTGINFVLPSAPNGDGDDDAGSTDATGEDDSRPSAPIPIVVLNGLSNCTALMARMGGYKNLIRAGLLPCAAVPGNSIDDPQNHELCEKLDEMKSTALEQDNIRNFATTTPCASVQYWKINAEPVEETPWLESASFVPMAPAISLGQTHENNANRNEKLPLPSEKAAPASYQANERDSPIDEAVRMALEAGCEACIVSSHREEIRELYKNRCGYRHQRVAIPYCCIGIFEVLLDDDNHESQHSMGDSAQSLQWILHDVVAPDQMSLESVFNIVSSYEKDDDSSTSSSFPITYPIIERTMLHLCETSLIVDDSATKQSITCIQSLSLTGVQAPAVGEQEDESHGERYTLSLQIVKGHGSWLEFLGRLHGDSALGTVDLVVDDDQSKLTRHRVLVRPENQSRLPCPPKTIRIEVLVVK